MKSADLIAMGVGVLAEDPEMCRPFDELYAVITCDTGPDGSEAIGLREVVRMLRDAADSAVDAHNGAPDVHVVSIARMRRFSALMTSALKEIT